jgi:hypothetical protein
MPLSCRSSLKFVCDSEGFVVSATENIFSVMSLPNVSGRELVGHHVKDIILGGVEVLQLSVKSRTKYFSFVSDLVFTIEKARLTLVAWENLWTWLHAGTMSDILCLCRWSIVATTGEGILC